MGGSGSQDAVGQIDGANDFDGNEDAISCGAGLVPDMDYHTVSAWVHMPLTGDTNQEVVCSESTASPYSGVALYVDGNSGALGKWLNGTYRYASQASSAVTANQWTFAAIRGYKNASAGYLEVSTNGGPWERFFTGDTANLQVPGGTPLIIGKWPGGGPDASARGTFDEIQIANEARSDEWIRAQYLSTSGSFVTIGAQEAACP